MVLESWTIEDFEENLRELFENNHQLCWDFVSAAIGQNDDFSEYDFFYTDEFLTIFLDGRSNRDTVQQAKNIIYGIASGYDLDNDTKGADIDAGYLRWDGDAIDSCSDPAEYIYEDALDDIVEYIKYNLEEDWYPNDILNLIQEYSDNGGDIDI